MKSVDSPAPRRLSILACTMLLFGAGACATPTVTIPSAFDCARRVPPDLRDDVPGAELPEPTAGGYAMGFDAQTGRLDQANDEKRTVIWIYDNCEAERREVIQELTGRTVWQRLTPWRE